jgi:CBS domain-containing protein
MSNLKAILDAKPRGYHSVPVTATAAEAVTLMADKGIGVVLVMDGSELTGIFSERDFVRCVARRGMSALDAPIREVMTQPVRYVTPAESVEQCMALMTEKHFRHLPVVSAGKVCGLVSMTDIVKELIADQMHVIRGLENYITSRDQQL